MDDPSEHLRSHRPDAFVDRYDPTGVYQLDALLDAGRRLVVHDLVLRIRELEPAGRSSFHLAE